MADPITRQEIYLAYIAGEYSGELPTPVTREEQYLYNIAVNGTGSTVEVTQIKESGEKIATITVDGEATDIYASTGGGGGAVDTVNGMTGDVVLTASDVGALPDDTPIPAAQVNADWTASSGVSEILHKPTLGTAAGKNSTNAVTEGSADLVESGAVFAGLSQKVDKNGTDRLMTAAEGTKLSGIEAEATKNAVINTTCTLTVAGWTGADVPYTQTVNVAGILATDVAICDVAVSSTVATGVDEMDDWALISKIESGAGTLTFSCYEDKPITELTVNVKVVR